MATHRFWMPDWSRGGEPRMIDWDDETGEVSGDHVELPGLREMLERAEEHGGLGHYVGEWHLPDPRRDAAQFLCVLRLALMNPGWDPRGVPAKLRDVEPTPLTVEYELPEGTDA